MYTPTQICNIIDGAFLQEGQVNTIEYLATDSRKILFPANAVFFALTGLRRNGHAFISELFGKGCRCFVVSENEGLPELAGATVIKVQDTLRALQKLAAFHRSKFSIPIIGITGSNGKTIVKEWLNQLLETEYHIARSPRSYNSQIGVPLSVWQLNQDHQLGIFEAGISRVAEMERLEAIIRPEYGILTHIGEAHDEGFENLEEKVMEKLKLFRHSSSVIAPADNEIVSKAIKILQHKNELTENVYSWGYTEKADLQLQQVTIDSETTRVVAVWEGNEKVLMLPFTDAASLENAMTCWLMLLLLHVPDEKVSLGMLSLSTVAMRLELKKGIFQSAIVNDSYNADLGSLRIALEFLKQQFRDESKTVILSDIVQHGRKPEQLYRQVSRELRAHQITRFIGIGEEIQAQKELFLQIPDMECKFYPDTGSFLSLFNGEDFRQQAILLKGARKFEFEQISQLLEQKLHQTTLEINLSALSHNLSEYRRLLAPGAQLMAMVKAYSYGTGSVEIAARLQFNQVDYLTVAYADEGVELRKGGITLPIMVMNAEPATFEVLLQYNLEPVAYSFPMLDRLSHFMRHQGEVEYPIHIELETGMNRLGFLPEEIEKLAEQLSNTKEFRIKTVFSHLAASDDPAESGFTMHQANIFKQGIAVLEKKINHPFLRHISNTAGISRYPQLQMDMVRLGIGLYGVSPSGNTGLSLQPVGTLTTTVAQLKQLHEGDTIGYNRRGVAHNGTLIATVRIGYADGYPRKLGNGNGKMWINGKLAPTVGAICMDMTMIDVSGLPDVREGDRVVVFGNELPVEQLAAWADTIPYEILTGISQRVKRVYFED